MLTIPVMPLQSYNGTRTFGPANIPQGVELITLALDATNMQSASLAMQFNLDLRLDNAAQEPWASVVGGGSQDYTGFPCSLPVLGGKYDAASGTRINGDQTNRDGSVQTQRFVTIPVPHPELPNRQLKGSVVFSEPVTTKGDLTLAP